MPASETEVKETTCWHCLGRACLTALCLLLGLTFLLQVFLIVLLYPNGEIDMPDVVIHEVNERLAKQGLQLELESVHLDLRGYVGAKGLALGFVDGEKKAFTADEVLVGFKPWGLAIGHIVLDEVRILGGNLNCPPVLSPTGVRDRIINNINLTAHHRRNLWNVERFNLEAADVRVALHGLIPESLLAGDPNENASKELAELESGYHELCRKIYEVEKSIKGLKNPLLLLQLSNDKAGVLDIHTTLQTSGYKAKNGASFGQNLTQASFTMGLDWILRGKEPALMTLHDAVWPEQASCGFAVFRITPHNGPEGVFAMPEHITSFFYELDVQGLGLDGALVIGDLTGLPDIKVNGGVKRGESWIDAYGTLNLLDEKADMHLSGRWDPKLLLKAKPFQEMKELPDMDFSERPFFRSHVVFDDNWKFNHTWIQLDSGPARYETLQVESLFTNAQLVPGMLRLYDTALKTKDYAVDGSYWQDLKTDDYRFILNGTLKPLDISFLVGEQWWEDTWKLFTFKDKLPRASLDLQGRYGGGRKHKQMFCRALLPACDYYGVPLEEVSAYIWQESYTLDMMDLYIKSNNGHTLSQIQFLYIPKGTDRLSITFLGSSDMQPKDVCQIIGPEAMPYGEIFTSDQPPRTQAAGIIYGEDSPHAGDLYLQIDTQFSEETTFDDIRFGSLAIEVMSVPSHVSIQNIDATLGGGKLTGSAMLNGDADPTLHLDLDLKDADLYGVFTAIPVLNTVENKADANAKAKSTKDGEAGETLTTKERLVGEVDIDFKGDGKPGKLATFQGAGKVDIREAQLGRLHLFGGLSRLLDSLGISFGTFDFTEANGDYTLDKGNLHLPKAEIKGSTARIEANGYYFITENKLDFILTLYPLGGISVPVVSTVLSVLDPISNTIEVELKGDLEDPDWSTSFGLMRAFRGQNQVEMPDSTKSNPSDS